MTLDTLMQFAVKATIDDLTGAPLEAVSLAAVCATCEVAKQEWWEVVRG